MPYTWSNPWWPEFFGRIADALVAHVQPKRALDAGCALGFLVAALRERNVDAYGVDVSQFAIEQVPEASREFCRVGSVTEPFGARYDVVICIEVLEHLPPEDAEPAIANLCDHGDRVLFSSTPTDDVEPTHLNVRPTSYWASLFAARGYFRDMEFDAAVVAPHACLFVRESRSAVDLAGAYEELYVQARLREADLLAEVGVQQEQIAAAAVQADRPQASQLYRALLEARTRLAPPSTRRDAVVRAVMRRARSSR